MSVNRSLALRAELAELINRRVPLPSTSQDFQDRIFALVDVLVDDLIADMRWRNEVLRDRAIPEAFLVDRLSSFAADLLLPFALDRSREIPIDSQVKH